MIFTLLITHLVYPRNVSNISRVFTVVPKEYENIAYTICFCGGGLRKQGVFVFRAIFACLGEELGEKLFFAYNL